MEQLLEINALTLDPELQPRLNLDQATVDEYTDILKDADRIDPWPFPPVQVIQEKDTGKNWLWDGFHRVQAAQNADVFRIPATVMIGDRDLALWRSVSANKTHGLRRTQADKRRAVETALSKFPQRSDRELAQHCGVSHPTVSKIRQELESTGKFTSQPIRTGADGRAINTANIGAKPRAESVDCPHCNQAIYITQDTRPGGAIICDSCKHRFADYDALMRAVEARANQTANPNWRYIFGSPENCYICGSPADYHNNGWRDQPGADFHLCSSCYGRHNRAVTGFTDADKLQKVLENLEDQWVEQQTAAPKCADCGAHGKFSTYGTDRRLCYECWLKSPEFKAAATRPVPAAPPPASTFASNASSLSSQEPSASNLPLSSQERGPGGEVHTDRLEIQDLKDRLTEALTPLYLQGDLRAWRALVYLSAQSSAKETVLAMQPEELCRGVARTVANLIAGPPDPAAWHGEVSTWLAQFDLAELMPARWKEMPVSKVES